jgi:putative DNA primase/helicase
MVWPDVSGSWKDVDRWPDSDARKKANTVFECLDKLDSNEIGASVDDFDPLPYLRFSNGSLSEFRIWRNAYESRLRNGELHPALESHLAKYRKPIPGLALIIHLAEGNTGCAAEQGR